MTGVLRHKSMLLMTTAALGFYVTTARGAGVDLDTAGGSYDISAAGGNQTIESLSGVSGTSVLLGPNTLTFGNATNQIFAGTISGTGGIVKQGSGTQILTGANDFSGGTNFAAGGIVVGNNSALGSGGITVNGNAQLDNSASVSLANRIDVAGGATLSVNGSNGLTLGGVISGGGGLTKNGAATLTLSGSNTYTGGTTINAGTLAVGAYGSLASTGAMNLAGAGAALDISGAVSSQSIGGLTGAAGTSIAMGANSLTFGGAANTTFGGTIGGTGAIAKSGSGTQTLTGTNTYTGGTTINAGTLALGAGGALAAAGSVNLGASGAGFDISGAGGNQTIGALSGVAGTSVTLGPNTLSFGDATNQTFAGTINGTGGIVKQGIGRQTLTGTNTYTGGTTINAGTLALGAGGALAAAGSVNLGASGAGFDISGAGSNQTIGALSGGAETSVTLGPNTLIFGDATNQTFAGTINGTGGIVKQSIGTQTLTGTNTYTGGTTINAGTLALGAGGALATGGFVNLGAAGADFDISAAGSQTIGALSGVAGTRVTLGPGTLSFGDATSRTFAGAISGAGSIVKQGSGRQVFNGISIHAGLTSVMAGSLIIGDTRGTSASIAGNVTVGAGATIGGHGRIGGDLTLASGSHLSPGASIGTLTVDGNLTVGQGSQLDFEFGAPGINFATFGQSDSVSVRGDLTVNASVLNVINGGGMGPGLYNLFSYGGALSFNGGGFFPPAGSAIQILTGTKQINLVNMTPGVELNFWNANGLAGPSQMGGGSGTWSVANANWTDSQGSFTGPMTPQPGFAIFGGASGTVTVDDNAGTVGALGMQFASDGYRLDGDILILQSQNATMPEIRVGDGSAASANWTATIDTVIAGIDGITKTGAGTLVLNASNLYSGGTRISAGTLSVSNDSNMSFINGGLILDGGTLRITGTGFSQTARSVTMTGNGGGFDIADAEARFTVSQALSGSGALVKSGDGTLVLSGANSYSGGTLVNGGTLQGDTESLQGNIINNARLVFDQQSDGAFAGDLSGTGTFVKSGGGKLVLSGANSYSGGTLVSGGTLLGDTASLQGNITNNAQLVFDQQSDGIFTGSLSGSGSLVKQGSGMLVFNGNGAGFAGSTVVENGMLKVGDADPSAAVLGGDVTIGTGGTLRGHGVILGSVTNQGILRPGGSVGTLTINGNLVQTANSVLQIDTTPAGEAGKLVVGGSAQLAGGLSIIGENGSWSPQTNYTILTSAGGISGTFANIDSNLAFLTPSLTYGATTIDLRLNRNDTSFASVGETRNQKAVAGAADRLGRGEVYNALVSLSAAEARAGFDALSGEIHASVKGALIDESRFARDAIGDRLRAAFDANCKAGNPVWTGKGSAGAYGQACANTAETAFWLQGYGAWGSNDGDGNAAKLSGSTGGVFIGTDIPVGSWRTGLMAGYGNSSFDADDRFSSADVDSYTLGAYAGTVIEKVGAGDIGLRFGATHSWYNIDTGRSISFAGFKAVEETSYDAQALQLFGEAGYKMQAGRASFEPFANLAYVRLHTDGYDGDGVAGLHSDSDNSDVTYTTLGLRAATDLTLGGLASTLHATLGWQHAAGDITPVARHAFAGSEPFSVAGVPVAEDAALIEAGLNFQFSEDASLAAGYKGQFGDGAVRNGFNASFNVKF
ncbi:MULTISPECIES: autotransporter-associated beta strand repeat-containing protein [Brucella/Ochrobactrum group]|uniref:autotransporter-associated beta strand repeat-containing protein n=1 Tax=Brucella/Ochrobactrum group TaxID=2826938 RepID=UPI00178C5512|nr:MULTISPECIES: autotransporter-associated beta strand repeat-containing protein [Brucella/Ochrobactrum group]MCQ9145104.1 autotransporter-associated beta strand repeat-containing protein [Ochrobactrum sp. BTU2]UGQ23231.1 autotransporter-associated beta strand repeat-containing protein [Brucella anthropi]